MRDRFRRACAVVWLGAVCAGCGNEAGLLGPVSTAGGGAVGNRCRSPIAAALTTDRYQLFGADGPEGQAVLRAMPLSGRAPYTYQWYVVDPAGDRADDLLDVTDTAEPRFTAGTLNGPYDIFCTVTDASGCSFTDKIVLTVGTSVALDLTTERFGVMAGGGEFGTTTLRVNLQSGVAPHTVDWDVVGPDGLLDNARLDLTDPFNPRFISGDEVGTYVVTATVTDATRATSVESAIVLVGQHLGLDVTAARRSVLPGGGADGTVELLATPIGGSPPNSYSWEVIGPGGQNDDGLLTDTTAEAPLFESAADTGPYLVRCTVTDGNGERMIASTAIVVGQQLALDVFADRLTLAPGGALGGTAVLTADVRGGRLPVSIEWSVTGPTGEDATDLLDATDAGTVEFTSGDEVGTYVVRCLATDADGVTVTAAMHVIVRTALSLDVTADRVFVGALSETDVINLTATPTGGEAPFSYAWTATGGAFLDETPQADRPGTSTNRWYALTGGTYTVAVTLTDGAGQTVRDSIALVVSAAAGFTLDVSAARVIVSPGDLITLTGDRSGGVANFEYAWTSTNEAGASAGTFGAATQPNVPDDTANTWIAPTGTGVDGTYRIRCTATDAQGNTTTDTVMIEVSSLAVQNTFFAPAAANNTTIHGGAALTAASGNPSPGQSITAGLTNPVYPRNVTIAIFDIDNSISGGTARVIGLDARGESLTELIAIGPSVGGGSVQTGVSPFATVTQIDLYGFAGANALADFVSAGPGTKFGLTGVLESFGDVLYVNEDGTVLTAGYTVDAQAGQQGITFAAAPDGARDYTVVFRVY